MSCAESSSLVRPSCWVRETLRRSSCWRASSRFLNASNFFLSILVLQFWPRTMWLRRAEVKPKMICVGDEMRQLWGMCTQNGSVPIPDQESVSTQGNGFMAALGMMIAGGNDEAGSTKWKDDVGVERRYVTGTENFTSVCDTGHR